MSMLDSLRYRVRAASVDPLIAIRTE